LPAAPPDDDLPPQPRSRADGPRNWRFLAQPFWIFSHVFALAVIISFVFLGRWQLHRLDERRATNQTIETRSFGDPVTVAEAVDRPLDQLDFLAVADTGHYIDPEVVRVVNRSQDGAAGEWIVGLFETDSGHLILVNRGFVIRDAVAATTTDTEIVGWLRASQVKESVFGATDDGQTTRVPRLDVDAIAARLGLDDRSDTGRESSVAPVWVQLAPPLLPFAPEAADPAAPIVPEPVPLPPLDEGPHLSYALQWFTFAAMGAVVYGLILRRKAAEVV
jgi:cytochrome oxidase assembly protein ShyY1